MPRSVQQPLPAMELERVEKRDLDALNKVEGQKLRMAKAGVGAAIAHAIGDAPAKTYGDKGWISNVTAGPGVPDYLARIWADPPARRRLGMALLKGDPKVKVRLVVEIEEG